MSISVSQYERAVYVAKPAADILREALHPDPRGRRGLDPLIWLTGMFLSIQVRKSATVADTIETLTVSLPRELQWDLGVLTGPVHNPRQTTAYDLYNLTRRVSRFLDYTESRQPALTDAERERRQEALWELSQGVLRQTLPPRPEGSSAYALDGTGLESAENGVKKPEEIPVLESHEEDLDEPVEVIQEAQTITYGQGCKGGSDGRWGMRSGKHGQEPFFGYDVEGLVRAPRIGERGADRREPALLEALVVLSASTDIVKPALTMFDRLSASGVRINEILVDRHYSFKDYLRWRFELLRRRIEQVSDLRSEDHRFDAWHGVRMLGGHPHCPCTPDRLADLPKPDSRADPSAKKDFDDAIAERQAYALQIVARPTADNLRMRVRCPARNGTVGCNRVAGTVAVALQTHEFVVSPDPEKTCLACSQDTMTLRITTKEDRKQMKNHQENYWGSPAWQASYDRRTHVEGYFGCLQNPSIGALRRVTHQFRGLALVTIVYSMAAAVTNMHNLRKWHEETGRGDPEHPLLKPDRKSYGFTQLTEESAKTLDLLYGEKPEPNPPTATRRRRSSRRPPSPEESA
jgi:hypothetical protein